VDVETLIRQSASSGREKILVGSKQGKKLEIERQEDDEGSSGERKKEEGKV